MKNPMTSTHVIANQRRADSLLADLRALTLGSAAIASVAFAMTPTGVVGLSLTRLAIVASAALVVLTLTGALGDYRGLRLPLAMGSVLMGATSAVTVIVDLPALESVLLGAVAGLVLPGAVTLAARPRERNGSGRRALARRPGAMQTAVLAAAAGSSAAVALEASGTLPVHGRELVTAIALAIIASRVPTTSPYQTTPRALVPLPLRVPRSARRSFKSAIRLAVAASTLAVLTASSAPRLPDGDAIILIAAGGSFSCFFICSSLVEATRVISSLEWTVTIAAVLRRAALTVACLALVGLGLTRLAPVVETAWVLGASGIALIVVLTPRAGTTRPGLSRPGTAGYRRAVRSFDRTAAVDPDLAATATTVAEVSALISEARSADLAVRPQSTGHAAATSAPFRASALLKVEIAGPIVVNRTACTVRIPAGATWGDVVKHIVPLGFGVSHGSSSDVGAVGYLLRGGMSCYGRSQGVASNSIESIELVLADGSPNIVDRSRHPELFWALRGGGGGLGVVTAITIRVFALSSIVTGITFWNFDRARDLLNGWVELNRDAPRSLTSSFRVLNLPSLPGLPRTITSGPVVAIDGVSLARSFGALPDAEDAVNRMLTPLRAIEQPLIDSWKASSPLEATLSHMDPPIGLPHVADHQLLRDLGPEGIDAFLGALRPSDPGFSAAELRHLGGAFSEAPADGGAVSRFDGEYATFVVSSVTKRHPVGSARERVALVRSALTDWDTGTVVPSFAPERSVLQRPFGEDVARRVAAVRRSVDPSGVFALDVMPGTR